MQRALVLNLSTNTKNISINVNKFLFLTVRRNQRNSFRLKNTTLGYRQNYHNKMKILKNYYKKLPLDTPSTQTGVVYNVYILLYLID